MYSEKVMDHFQHPRNVGEIENASGVGTVGNAKCGDIMRMYLDIDDNGIIQDCKFKTFGCGAAVATSSMATELVKGKTIQEALEVTNKAVMEALDGLPPVKVHCSLLAEEAIHAALWDYAEKHHIKIEGLSKPKSDISEGETEEEYHERMIFTERRIAERVGKKRRDKWTRNYTAYRQAEALGMRAERDIYGNVTVPELKQLDAEYAAALKNSGVTAAGDMRKDYDWQALTPEQKKRWQKRARMAWKISEEEKELDAVIVYNERYAERMRQLMAEKREYVVDVENNQ